MWRIVRNWVVYAADIILEGVMYELDMAIIYNKY